MANSTRRAGIAAGAAAWATVLAACGGELTLPDDGGGPGSAGSISVLEGNGQNGVVGEPLAVPLRVRVTADGLPVSGQGVAFLIEAGGGELAPDTTVTNPAGEATSRWTLGIAPGTQTAAAKLVAGGNVVRFTAQATVGAPHSIELISGNGQNGEPFEPLDEPLVVRVADRFGNAVEDVTVTWTVVAGGGELSARSVATDATGRSQVTWTLGFFLGTQRVRAAVDGLEGSPVGFEADIF